MQICYHQTDYYFWVIVVITIVIVKNIIITREESLKEVGKVDLKEDHRESTFMFTMRTTLFNRYTKRNKSFNNRIMQLKR